MSKPGQNQYLQYKQETSILIRWILTTASKIPSACISSSPTTTTIKISTLLTLSQLISTHINSIPSSIYAFFRSVIAARKEANAWYSNFVSASAFEKDDKEILASNERHRAFNNALETAFIALGGKEWEEKLRARTNSDQVEADDDEAPFINSFDGLKVDDAESDEEEEETEGQQDYTDSFVKSSTKQKGKGKGKGKRKAKSKAKAKAKSVQPPMVTIEDIPLANYKLLDDEEANGDLHIAVWSLIGELLSLRMYNQELWVKTTVGERNSAVAGAMSQVIISRIKQLQFEIAADFPGYSTYEAIMTVLVGPGKSFEKVNRYVLYAFPEGQEAEVKDGKLVMPDNIKDSMRTLLTTELYGVDIYNDMVAFIQDYRKTRNGKPTKQMQKRMSGWEPHLKLGEVSDEERFKWRSKYTLRWLYDLINGKIASPRVKVSLWGLGEFAGELATMALKKTSDPIDLRPHHIFTMIVALDVMTMARGWQVHPTAGSTIIGTPTSPWAGNTTFRDLLLFTRAREGSRSLLYTAQEVLETLTVDSIRYNSMQKNTSLGEDIQYLVNEALSLGEPHMFTDTNLRTLYENIPESQFGRNGEETEKAGLWLYSPFLCATGLAEGLTHSYHRGLAIWDKSGAPMAMIHLYNILKTNGHIPEKIPLFAELIQLFCRDYFVTSQPPEKFFKRAYLNALRKFRGAPGGSYDHHCLLRGLIKHDWLPEKVLDEEIPLRTMVGQIRLYEQRSADSQVWKASSAELIFPAVKEKKQSKKPLSKPGTKDRNIETPLFRRYRACPSAMKSVDSPGWTDFMESFTKKQGAGMLALQHTIANEIEGDLWPNAGVNYMGLCGYLIQRFDMFLDLLQSHGLDSGQTLPGLNPKVTHERIMSVVFKSCDNQDTQGTRCDSEVLRMLGRFMWDSTSVVSMGDFMYWNPKNISFLDP